MTRKDIQEKVNQFLVDDFEIEASRIVPSANLREDLEFDSLDFVDIIAIVDKTFGFKPIPLEMKQVITMEDFYDYIERNL